MHSILNAQINVYENGALNTEFQNQYFGRIIDLISNKECTMFKWQIAERMIVTSVLVSAGVYLKLNGWNTCGNTLITFGVIRAFW